MSDVPDLTPQERAILRTTRHPAIERSGGGHKWDNLQALCRSGHSRKTARETGFAGW